MGEVNMFWECVADAKRDNGLAGVNKINSFMEYKKQVRGAEESCSIYDIAHS